MRKRTGVSIAFALLAMPGPVMEATAQHMAGGTRHGGMGQEGMTGKGGQGVMMAQASDAMAEGVVRKVDKEAGKLTIKHGAIPAMDMPAMTMVYRVKDPAILDQVKPGDKVTFAMEKIGGQFTVTRIAAAK